MSFRTHKGRVSVLESTQRALRKSISVFGPMLIASALSGANLPFGREWILTNRLRDVRIWRSPGIAALGPLQTFAGFAMLFR